MWQACGALMALNVSKTGGRPSLGELLARVWHSSAKTGPSPVRQNSAVTEFDLRHWSEEWDFLLLGWQSRGRRKLKPLEPSAFERLEIERICLSRPS